ncbi:Asp23/Gls24 family envelope stress response protein [Frondihabitans cladoniiphilus]|uniref:Cell envelope-related Asp23 family protein n=1 Tax=Frondihabitans cladoniiphilus TaxID=715785 RepID=A0ABP8W352_9MICO
MSDTVTLERLSDYLDRGRVPYDPAIEDDPSTASQLAALQRLRTLSGRLVYDDAAAQPEPDPSWFSGVMDRVRLESRAGRDIPLGVPLGAESGAGVVSLHMTEGAVRGLVREAGDSISGAVVISCALDGDVTTPDAPVRVEVTISALRGEFVPAMADDVREAVGAALLLHTELAVTAVDIVIGDVHLLDEEVAR